MGPLQCLTDHYEPVERLSLAVRMVNLLVVILPFVGLILTIVLVWGWGFTWVHLGLFVAMYLISGLGITVGFHRLFTHRAFETSRVMKFILAASGSMAVQGPLITWVAHHRKHHRHSDEHDDPHSPHLHGHGLRGMLQGLWHAHVGWIFVPYAPNMHRYVRDLTPDRMLRVLSSTFSLWALVGLLVPTILGGILTMSWTGALLGFIWGGLARIFLVHHVTWSINSICHLWGSQPFRSQDQSRNNLIFGVLGLGEGWHNNHHAFPTSARHGLYWWQIDVGWWVIHLMARLGLVWNVRIPATHAMSLKRRDGANE